MVKYVVLREDLPEVIGDSRYGTVDIAGELYSVTEVWANPLRWREKAMHYIAIAEYLDSLKPKVPTEPGSVILVTKLHDFTLMPKGNFLSLGTSGLWHTLDDFTRGIHPRDIEEWVPVKLVPQLEDS